MPNFSSGAELLKDRLFKFALIFGLASVSLTTAGVVMADRAAPDPVRRVGPNCEVTGEAKVILSGETLDMLLKLANQTQLCDRSAVQAELDIENERAWGDIGSSKHFGEEVIVPLVTPDNMPTTDQDTLTLTLTG